MRGQIVKMKLTIRIKKSHAFFIAGAFFIFLTSIISSGTYTNSQTGVGHNLDELRPGYFPGDFEVTGNLIVNDIVYKGLYYSYPDNSLVKIIADTNGSYDTRLVYGDHGASDCFKIGGDIVVGNESDPLDEDYFCRLSGTCPSGWHQYEQWSTTTGKSCCGNNAACSSACASPNGHSWANKARESERYRSGRNAFGGWCKWKTCRTGIAETGCY